MKCQHCGSTDIIAIQGQNYCLNCGYSVADAPVKAVRPQVGQVQAKPTVALGGARPAKSGHASVAKKKSVKAGAFNLRDTPRHASHTHTWRSSAHPLRFSLQVSAAVALAVAALVGFALWFQLDNDLIIYIIAASLVVLVIEAILAQSALLYGLSRFEDGRPTPRRYWWAAARDGFMDVINADMVALIVATAVVFASTTVWRLSLQLSALSLPERIVFFGAINLVLGWILVGTYVIRRLAMPAIVIGGVTASEGMKLGYRLYLQAGGRLVVVALEAIFGRAVAAVVLAVGVFYVVHSLSSAANGQTIVLIASIVTVAAVVFVLVLVLLEWEARIWLRHYRHWATTFSPAERIRLLTGRLPAKS